MSAKRLREGPQWAASWPEAHEIGLRAILHVYASSVLYVKNPPQALLVFLYSTGRKIVTSPFLPILPVTHSQLDISYPQTTLWMTIAESSIARSTCSSVHEQGVHRVNPSLEEKLA